MRKTVRVAVIGSGRWGSAIIRTLRELPGATITHIATRNFAELVGKSDIDAVVVATPPETHAAVALPFIKRGLPVFIEKPLTLSVSEGKRLLNASRESGSLVFVGHLHLYSPAFNVLKKEAGKAGKLHMLIGEGMSYGPFRESYSALWDWAPHDLSMMLALEGMPSHVAAWGIQVDKKKSRLHDFTSMLLSFPSGAVGVIHSSKISPEKRRTLTVVGSKNSVVYNDTLPTQKIAVYKNYVPAALKPGVRSATQKILYPAYSPVSPLTKELEAFIRMVSTQKKPESSLESGLAVVKILAAAEKSIALNGARVKI